MVVQKVAIAPDHTRHTDRKGSLLRHQIAAGARLRGHLVRQPARRNSAAQVRDRSRFARVVHDGEEIAAKPAHVRQADGRSQSCTDGRIDSIATDRQCAQPALETRGWAEATIPPVLMTGAMRRSRQGKSDRCPGNPIIAIHQSITHFDTFALAYYVPPSPPPNPPARRRRLGRTMRRCFGRDLDHRGLGGPGVSVGDRPSVSRPVPLRSARLAGGGGGGSRDAAAATVRGIRIMVP